MMRSAFAAFLFAIALLQPVAAADLLFASIGTGTYGGGYYSTARALCARINTAERGRMRCSPEATAGSIYNLRALEAGEIDLAIAQSDWSFNALNGKSVFDGNGMAGAFRGVAALYVEAVTILASATSGITHQSGLLDGKVDIGHPASGRRATIEVALNAFGLTRDSFSEVVELPDDAAIEAVCSGRIDATILTLGHPSALIRRAMENCGARLVPLGGAPVQQLVTDHPYYVLTEIPANTYPGQSLPVQTFGVRAFLLARTSLNERIVARIARELLSVTQNRLGMPPVMRQVVPTTLRDIEALVPLHHGAASAYREAGLGE